MVTASKATVPTISDQASAMQLSQCAKNLASALAELRTASQKVLLFYYPFNNYTAEAPQLYLSQFNYKNIVIFSYCHNDSDIMKSS